MRAIALPSKRLSLPSDVGLEPAEVRFAERFGFSALAQGWATRLKRWSPSRLFEARGSGAAGRPGIARAPGIARIPTAFKMELGEGGFRLEISIYSSIFPFAGKTED